ncbi:hypothetical protein [Baaleninema sp.]|uniref:hypothetical protein n=1 Tax=Baaleninema sp. TaxID=3101197 RepID=UPI003D08FA29
MSPTPSQLLEQAKQGDPKAIAALMNRSTQPKGISVKATLKDRCLQVLLEGENAPSQKNSVGFVREGMLKLDIDSIDRVRVYGRQVGRETPVWQEEIVLKTPSPEAPPPSTPPELSHRAVPLDELADENLLPNDLLEGYYKEGEEPLEDADEFPEPPPEAEAFLNDDVGDEYAEDEDSYEDYEEGDYEEGDYEEGDYEEGDYEEGGEEEDAEEMASQPKKKSSLVGLIVLLVLVVLAGGGYYLYTTKPELFSAIPFLNPGNGTEGEEATPEAAPTTPTEEAPEADATEAPDPFGEAVNAAIAAAESAQTASTPQQWQQVADNWQTAIDKMKAVPEDHPKYDVAQQKAQDYQKNLDYARQQAQ